MNVILLENIEGLGRKGDQVEVREGFGRNNLLPQRRAILASPDAMSRLTSMKAKFAVEESKIIAVLTGVAGKLEGLKIELSMRATPEGHLFGSVSSHLLAETLKAKGHDIAERDLRIKEPIKSVGTYTVGVHLHADVKMNITVVVEAEGATPAVPEEGAAEAGAAADAATKKAPASDGAAATKAAESSI